MCRARKGSTSGGAMRFCIHVFCTLLYRLIKSSMVEAWLLWGQDTRAGVAIGGDDHVDLTLFPPSQLGSGSSDSIWTDAPFWITTKCRPVSVFPLLTRLGQSR